MSHALEQAEQTDPLAEYRPSGHMLMLMLRASAVDDGHGGPWLSLTRARNTGTARVFVHHISVTEPHAFSNDRLVLCSGVELLGKFCALTRGVPANILNPNRDELRALGDWTVTRVNAPLWDADARAWLREYMGPLARDRRARELDDAASRVRSLRWLMAEEWLR